MIQQGFIKTITHIHSRLSRRMQSCFRYMLKRFENVNLQLIVYISMEHQINRKYILQQMGDTIGDEDRKRAPFLVLGLPL